MGKADAARVSAPNPEWVYMSHQWKIELGQRVLRPHGTPVPIGNRAFQIISVLVQSAYELVSKDSLMGRVWGAIGTRPPRSSSACNTKS
jgi:DNA-binding winged helix-turn-helix (wHTH) protein